MMREVRPNYSIEDVREIFRNATIDHQSKTLRYSEFLATALGVSKENVNEDRLWRAFDRLDHEAKGKITRDNLARLLGKDYSETRMDMLWNDHNFGAWVSFEEFRAMFDV